MADANPSDDVWLQIHGCGHEENKHLCFPRCGSVPFSTQMSSIAVANSLDTLFVATADGARRAFRDGAHSRSDVRDRAGIYVARASETVREAKKAHAERRRDLLRPLHMIEASPAASPVLVAKTTVLAVVEPSRVTFYDAVKLARGVRAAAISFALPALARGPPGTARHRASN